MEAKGQRLMFLGGNDTLPFAGLTVEDFKTGVFFELGRSYILGFAHMNGLLDSTELILTVPGGLLPNHEYRICGTLIYQAG